LQIELSLASLIAKLARSDLEAQQRMNERLSSSRSTASDYSERNASRSVEDGDLESERTERRRLEPTDLEIRTVPEV